MPISSDFIKQLEENARNQNRVAVPNITQNDILFQERATTVAQFEQEKLRKQQPSYSTARKLFNNESSQDVIFDIREKNAFNLQTAAKQADPVRLKEDIDGVFGGNNPLTKALFGSGIRDKHLGKSHGLLDEIGSRGVLGFFTGELLRSTPESEANVYEVLLDIGLTPEDAFKKAKARVAGDDQVLTAEEVSALQTYEKWDTAFKMLDAGFLVLDAATLGTATVVRPMLKSSARKVVAPFIKEAQTMTKRSDLRNLVVKTYPDLKGTEEIEKMLDIVEEYPKDFSIFKARQDFQRTKSFNDLAETVSPTPVKASTEMQRIVYENGIPVIRKTTPDTLVARRTATLETLKGEREALRLSNADVLAQEIKAGSLPLKTTADDTIDVWRIAPRGRRIKSGEEVSVVEDFAKSLSEGAKPQKIEVAVSDLVRLPDGTFTFAPERLIKEAPVLKYPKNIPKQVVAETKAKEAKITADKLAKKKAEQTAKREAAEKAERELMEPVEKAKRELKKLEEKEVNIKADAQKQIVNIRQKRDTALKGATPKEQINIKADAQKQIIEVQRERDVAVRVAKKELREAKPQIKATIDKAIETVGKTKTATKETSGKTASKKAGKESLKPVGEGAVKESKLYASTQEKVREIRKNLGETINSKEYEFYRQASNKDQLAKAAAHIEENGVEETVKALESAFRTGSDAVPGVLNNSLLIALEPELLKSGMTKYADRLLRLSSRMTTRFGQEIQVLSVLDRNNPLVVLHRLQNHLDNLVSDTKIGEATVNQGARSKAEKVLNDMVAKIDIKGGVKEAVDAIICK